MLLWLLPMGDRRSFYESAVLTLNVVYFGLPFVRSSTAKLTSWNEAFLFGLFFLLVIRYFVPLCVRRVVFSSA